MKTKLKDQKGFTIIEVLIVLAIAGLILLIVFLAVPALQRNSRNAQRKNDIASILGAISEYASNNNGALPATCAAGNAGCGASTSWLNNAKLGYFSKDKVAFTQQASAGAGSAPADAETIAIYSFAKCSDATTSAAGTSARQIAALYKVEAGSGNTNQCQESGS